jgi:hypothetical protein
MLRVFRLRCSEAWGSLETGPSHPCASELPQLLQLLLQSIPQQSRLLVVRRASVCRKNGTFLSLKHSVLPSEQEYGQFLYFEVFILMINAFV